MEFDDVKTIDALDAAFLDRDAAARALGCTRAELVTFLDGGSRGRLVAKTAEDRLRDRLGRRTIQTAFEALEDADTKVRLKALESTLKRFSLDSPATTAEKAPGQINITITPNNV